MPPPYGGRGIINALHIHRTKTTFDQNYIYRRIKVISLVLWNGCLGDRKVIQQ